MGTRLGDAFNRLGDLDRCLKSELSFFSLMKEELGGEKDRATIIVVVVW